MRWIPSCRDLNPNHVSLRPLEYEGTTIVPRRGIQCSARSDKPHSHLRAHARLSVDSPYPKAWKKPNPSVGKGRLRLSSGEGNEYGILD